MVYRIQHTFRNKVLVPMLAVYPNTSWIMDCGTKIVKTSEGVTARVRSEERIHFLSDAMQEAVERIYGTDVLSFGRRWYKTLDISTMEFLLLELEKEDANENA